VSRSAFGRLKSRYRAAATDLEPTHPAPRLGAQK
jgi:hypothetical protein